MHIVLFASFPILIENWFLSCHYLIKAEMSLHGPLVQRTPRSNRTIWFKELQDPTALTRRIHGLSVIFIRCSGFICSKGFIL